MRMLHHKFKHIKVIIPDFVYSSGTIMALGGNEIFMAVDASVGPLDKILENPANGLDISSLDVTGALTNLASTARSISDSIYNQLRKKKGISSSDAAKLALDTSTKMISPIIDKIDPYYLQSGFRQNRIGFNYAFDMLISRMMSNNIKSVLDACRKLVNDYPEHGYRIFRDELIYYLNLTVHNLEELPEWITLETKFTELIKQHKQSVTYVVF